MFLFLEKYRDPMAFRQFKTTTSYLLDNANIHPIDAALKAEGNR